MKIWNALLKTVQSLTAWPLITLYLALLFRKPLTNLIARLSVVKYKGLEADFEGFQELAQVADPSLTREVAVKLPEAQDQAAKSQPADEQLRPLLTASAASKSFAAASLAVKSPSADQDKANQQKIVSALQSGKFYWRTRERLLMMTGLPPEHLDTALASLLQQDVVKPAFSSSHNVIFGLRERVDEK